MHADIVNCVPTENATGDTKFVRANQRKLLRHLKL